MDRTPGDRNRDRQYGGCCGKENALRVDLEPASAGLRQTAQERELKSGGALVVPSTSVLPVPVLIAAARGQLQSRQEDRRFVPPGAGVKGFDTDRSWLICIGFPLKVYESLIVSESSGMYRKVSLLLMVADLPAGSVASGGKTTSENGVGTPGMLMPRRTVEMLPVLGIVPRRAVSQCRPSIRTQGQTALEDIDARAEAKPPPSSARISRPRAHCRPKRGEEREGLERHCA